MILQEENNLYASVAVALSGILLFSIIGVSFIASIDAGKGIRVIGAMKDDGRILL